MTVSSFRCEALDADIPDKSYDLPKRVHVARLYPVSAPNGSSIIVYGHENGLSLLWRGERPVKASRKERRRRGSHPKTDSPSSQAVISFESKSDEMSVSSAQSHLDEPILLNEQQTEYDSLQPHESVTEVLDLSLGTEVLHLAFPPLPSDLHESNLGSLPKLLLDRLLLVIGCADCSVRLVTIPLTPPSPNSKSKPGLENYLHGASTGYGIYREQVLTFDGGRAHREIPSGVSITLTMRSTATTQDTSMDDAAEQDTVRPVTNSSAQMESYDRDGVDGYENVWDILIASHSSDLSGLLVINRVPILVDGSSIDVDRAATNVPWRTLYLPSPAVCIQFNTSLYPASRHSQLLLADVKGVVRIFDCHADRGSWLINLYTESEIPTDGILGRKRILAAQWVLGGKAVVALLANAEWGIWDLEGSGPKAKHNSDLLQSATGLDLTKFAISGRIRTSTGAKPTVHNPTGSERTSRLAPMTPSTRKHRQEALFTGPAQGAEDPARGGLAVSAVNEGPNNRADDESLLLWYGNSILTIPSLLGHWQMKVRGSGNLLDNGIKSEVKQLNDVQLSGELWNSASLIPQRPQSTQGTKGGSRSQNAILVAGESRLLIITTPLADPSVTIAPIPGTRAVADDQALLAKGELDVNGIDHMLDNMTGEHQATKFEGI